MHPACLAVFALGLAFGVAHGNSSAHAAQPLPRSTPESQGVPSAAVLAFLDAAERVDQMHSFLLVRHGHVVAEGWWAPCTSNDPHMLYSLSKSFTSTAVGLAIAEGKLSLNDQVLSFFPDDAPANPSDNLRAMRIRDLLTMNTGQHEPDVEEFKFDGPRPLTKTFLAMPVAHKPGTHFVYNTPATYMCSAIVQKVTGEKVVDYLRPRLFEPLGIANPAWDESADGVSMGGTGLHVTTEDIAKFGQLYLQRGAWHGKQLIPAAWIDTATARQVSNGSNPDSDWEQGYGFQFWRCRHDLYRGDGAFGQFCIVMPQHDAVLAITSGVSDMQAVMNAAWDHLLPALAENKEAIAEDETTQSRLRDRLASLHLPTPTGKPDSPLATEIAGATFKFPANTLQLESLKLDTAGKEPVLTLRVQDREYAIPCGHDHWTRGASMPRLGDVRAPSAEARVAAAGAWTADDRYQAKLFMYETPYYLTLTLAFADDKVTLDGEYNVSFGERNLPQLVGQR